MNLKVNNDGDKEDPDSDTGSGGDERPGRRHEGTSTKANYCCKLLLDETGGHPSPFPLWRARRSREGGG
jgi:hypothetical protein